MDDALSGLIEERVTALGFELVELETAGSKTRPILRLRIDREGAEPGAGISVEDCTRVSRDIEAYLEERGEVGDRYVLEVSSPGIERPLVKAQDFARFAGKDIAIKTGQAIGELGKRIEGLLRGIEGDVVTVEVNGQPVEIAHSNIRKAHLVFKWDEKKK